MGCRVNSILLNPVFVLVVLLSGSNKLLELSGISIPVLHSYMDDLFCMPFVLTIVLFLMRRFIIRDKNYVLGNWQIAAAVIYCSVLFELILPQFSAKYTADISDVAAYIVGGIIFQKLINKPQLMPRVSLAARKISKDSSLVCDSA